MRILLPLVIALSVSTSAFAVEQKPPPTTAVAAALAPSKPDPRDIQIAQLRALVGMLKSQRDAANDQIAILAAQLQEANQALAARAPK